MLVSTGIKGGPMMNLALDTPTGWSGMGFQDDHNVITPKETVLEGTLEGLSRAHTDTPGKQCLTEGAA
jgi:hypothetical protein